MSNNTKNIGTTDCDPISFIKKADEPIIIAEKDIMIAKNVNKIVTFVVTYVCKYCTHSPSFNGHGFFDSLSAILKVANID